MIVIKLLVGRLGVVKSGEAWAPSSSADSLACITNTNIIIIIIFIIIISIIISIIIIIISYVYCLFVL